MGGKEKIRVVSIGATNEKSKISETQSPYGWLSNAFDLGMPVKVHTMDYMTDFMLRKTDGQFHKFEVQVDSDFETSLYYDYTDRTEIMDTLTHQIIQNNWIELTAVINDLVHETFDCTHKFPIK